MKFTDILYTERLELKVQDLSKEVSTLHAQVSGTIRAVLFNHVHPTGCIFRVAYFLTLSEPYLERSAREEQRARVRARKAHCGS